MVDATGNCYACGKPAKYNIMLAITGERLYLPNQIVRNSEPPHSGYGPQGFCKDCMRKIEDSLRATVLYLKSESKP